MAHPYCTVAAVKLQFPENDLEALLDDSGHDSETDKTARIAAAIEKADNTIDLYCGKKYSVPFDTIPDKVEEMSVDLTIYYLACRKWGNLEMGSTIKSNYDLTITLLKSVSKGEAVLSVPDPTANLNRVGKTSIDSDSRIMSRESLSGF